jgi:hypothetical protein
MNRKEIMRVSKSVRRLADDNGAASRCDLHIGTGTDQQGLKVESNLLYIIEKPPGAARLGR